MRSVADMSTTYVFYDIAGNESNMTTNESGNGSISNRPRKEDEGEFPGMRGFLGLLESFGLWYQNYHGYVSSCLCVFGIVSNLMNIAVLTRRSMTSPTNHLLTALAISDLLTMTIYLPYAIYFHCLTIPHYSHPHPRAWIVYLLFNSYFTITTHTVSMWLTVALAVFRYIAVCHHIHAPSMCSLWRARLTVIAIALATPLFCMPNYILYRSERLPTGEFWFKENQFVRPLHKSINYWVYGVIFKVVPCILLVTLSALLLRTMNAAKTRRRSLVSQRSDSDTDDRDHNRTTWMLLAVVFFFVASELPQGVLALLSGIDPRVFYRVYVPLGDVWDAVVIINSAVNFILYCIMSSQFRRTFWTLFGVRCLRRRRQRRPNGFIHDDYSHQQRGSMQQQQRHHQQQQQQLRQSGQTIVSTV